MHAGNYSALCLLVIVLKYHVRFGTLHVCIDILLASDICTIVSESNATNRFVIMVRYLH